MPHPRGMSILPPLLSGRGGGSSSGPDGGGGSSMPASSVATPTSAGTTSGGEWPRTSPALPAFYPGAPPGTADSSGSGSGLSFGAMTPTTTGSSSAAMGMGMGLGMGMGMRSVERAASNPSLRTATVFRPGTNAQSTIRAVTPEPLDAPPVPPLPPGTPDRQGLGSAGRLVSGILHQSPRSVPGSGGAGGRTDLAARASAANAPRPQGMVFRDVPGAPGSPFSELAPVPSPVTVPAGHRPRTHTVDGGAPLRGHYNPHHHHAKSAAPYPIPSVQQQHGGGGGGGYAHQHQQQQHHAGSAPSSAALFDTRGKRVGSFSSTGSAPMAENGSSGNINNNNDFPAVGSMPRGMSVPGPSLGPTSAPSPASARSGSSGGLLESMGYPSGAGTPSQPRSAQSMIPTPQPQQQQPSPHHQSKDRKSGSTRSRLMKRVSSRPTSPLVSPVPSVDSLPLPVPTSDANKVLLLMKNLCGRMRGEIEYRVLQSGAGEQQTSQGGLAAWRVGLAYIDEEKSALMLDPAFPSTGGPHVALVRDLRGCRILPVTVPGGGGEAAEVGQHQPDRQCLELHAAQIGVELLIRPLLHDELDLWLASLLCWQQLRPGGVKMPPRGGRSALLGGRGGDREKDSTGGGTTSPPLATPTRPEPKRRGSSNISARDGTIIKVGKVMLWDKGAATSPRAVVRRPSTRDLRGPGTAWRRVACLLQENGEFKLKTENDDSVISVIELGQLSRSAVQQLDRSVLDEEYCVAIFPIYSPRSTHLSIFRPVYIALDSRVLFEVWFVLLRAFAVPDMYRLTYDPDDGRRVEEIVDLDGGEPAPEEHEEGGRDVDALFRLERTLGVRVTEAKIKKVNAECLHWHERYGRGDDSLSGNYLAEVILDGEVRARTTMKTDTKNPFWREDCDFHDLPPATPFLSVILKRVVGDLDSFSHQLQASLGLPKTGNLTEVPCGAVDIALDRLEQGKDHEQWMQVLDERQTAVATMLLKVHHEELVVLRDGEYRPLADLLRRFSSGLTGQIAEAMPTHLRRLAEVLLNIFQVSGSAGDWLMALVEDEIDGIGNQTNLKKMGRFSRRLKSSDSVDSSSGGGAAGASASAPLSSDREAMVRDMGKSLAGEANLLFRGNSLLTQALEFHIRRLGKEYLEDTLGEKIFEINEVNADLEVDPTKVGQQQDLAPHWSKLIQLTTDVWGCIAASASRLPPELRHILKYIRAVADDRYGDFLRTVSYTSVSGFLFLRFICPAILNPKLFGLLRDHPRPRAQRTLTLIAKGLQVLANLANIGKKEAWMEPMNRFIAGHRQAVKDFLDKVCAIPAIEQPVAAAPTARPSAPGGVALQPGVPTTVTATTTAASSGPPLPASYSTPIAILGRLSPLAREGFPSLPYLVDQGRAFAALVRLWLAAHPPESRGAWSDKAGGNAATTTGSGSSSGAGAGAGGATAADEDAFSELVEFHATCVRLQRRADACLATFREKQLLAAEEAEAAMLLGSAGGGGAGGSSVGSSNGAAAARGEDGTGSVSGLEPSSFSLSSAGPTLNTTSTAATPGAAGAAAISAPSQLSTAEADAAAMAAPEVQALLESVSLAYGNSAAWMDAETASLGGASSVVTATTGTATTLTSTVTSASTARASTNNTPPPHNPFAKAPEMMYSRPPGSSGSAGSDWELNHGQHPHHFGHGFFGGGRNQGHHYSGSGSNNNSTSNQHHGSSALRQTLGGDGGPTPTTTTPARPTGTGPGLLQRNGRSASSSAAVGGSNNNHHSSSEGGGGGGGSAKKFLTGLIRKGGSKDHHHQAAASSKGPISGGSGNNNNNSNSAGGGKGASVDYGAGRGGGGGGGAGGVGGNDPAYHDSPEGGSPVGYGPYWGDASHQQQRGQQGGGSWRGGK